MRRRTAILATILIVGLAASSLAARRASPTWDEVVLVSAGARAVETGSWSLVVDQPPLMPWLYGIVFQIVGAEYPAEPGPSRLSTGAAGVDATVEWGYNDRWRYAREFYFLSGNDPMRIARTSRVVGALCLVLLGLVTFLYGRWIGGAGVGLVALFLVVLLPDAVAHSAIAYNDLPLALAFLASLWAVDVATRRRDARWGALAGCLVALAMGVKYSALALLPVALLLVGLELLGGRGAAGGAPGGESMEARLRSFVAPLGVAVLAAYATTVALYGGDFYLFRLEQGLRFTIDHASQGHPAPAYLFGATSADGFWYYFPAAFFVKTPGALHLLLPVAAFGLLKGIGGRSLRELLRSRMRAPVAGVVVFGAFLLQSKLNIGFRYALPLLPPLLLLVAFGVVRFWNRSDRRRRLAVGLLLFLYGGSTLASAPWFVSYRSEWFRAMPPGREPLLDSNIDWGQGLLELRDWMSAEGVDRVRLSYFGSALPRAMGIDIVALPSHLPLPSVAGAPGAGRPSDPAGSPEYTVISATNLHGLYLDGDPFAAYRERPPDVVLAGSLYVYRE